MNSINILNIQIDNLSHRELWVILNNFLHGSTGSLITTVNPEFILSARKNNAFRTILNNADLSLPDGFGLSLAALTYGRKLIRHTGADLTAELLAYAEKNNLPLAIINWRGGLSSAATLQSALLAKFPRLNLIIEDISRTKNLGQRQAERLAKFKPIILLSSLGSPWQEYFLDSHRSTWPSVRLMMGVGGSFDFITKRIKRAPKLWRASGLEWLWRLIQQPCRWRRIWRAVVVFSWQFLIWRFSNKKPANT